MTISIVPDPETQRLLYDFDFFLLIATAAATVLLGLCRAR